MILVPLFGDADCGGARERTSVLPFEGGFQGCIDNCALR